MATQPGNGGPEIHLRPAGQEATQRLQDIAGIASEQVRIRAPLNRAEKTHVKPAGGKASTPSIEQLRADARDSWAKLYGKDLSSLSYEERQVVEAAIALGYGPSDRAGKKAESPTAKEVIDNSLVDDNERIQRARDLLHLEQGELSLEQQEAIKAAHRKGAGVFENTRAQLGEKVKILKDAGFSEKQIRTIIESGLAAMPPPAPAINKAGLTDPLIGSCIDEINIGIAAGPGGWRNVEGAIEILIRLRGVNEAERTEALRRVGSALSSVQEERREGLYGERKLTPSEKIQIILAKKPEEIEQLFNRMFDRVDARPQADFTEAFGNAGTFEFEEFMKTLNEEITHNNDVGSVLRARELTLIVQQFANEKKAREVIHNAYFGVLAGSDTEAISKYMESFLSGWADMAFNKPGVTQAMHFYEQALLITRESAGGYLKPAEVVGEMKTNSEGKVNELARKLLEDANAKGLLVTDADGKPKKDAQGNVIQLAPWQIDRALAFARGMSIVTGRTIEIAASSILAPGFEAFSDQYAQRIIAELAPFRHMYKFFAGSKFSRVLAYTMNRGRKPWTTKDIEDYAKLQFDEQINVLNALVPEGKERFYSVLNPFEIGGILSRTGWRITKGEVSIINDLVNPIRTAGGNPDDAWIGTGVQIERQRGNLVKGDAGAKQAVEDQLIKIGERTPLRLLLNIRSVQGQVLNGWLTMEQLSASVSELALLQEEANLAKRPLDLSTASATTQELVTRIRGVWNGGERQRFLRTLQEKEWATPYTFGTDDVPYDQYSFETTGPRSVARRWGDMASASKAAKAMQEFVSQGMESFSTQEEIVKALKPIYEGIKGYNEDDAKKFISRLAEGVIKFYGKDYKSRLPLGIGTVIGMVTGKSSYAQIAYGREAMAWDELQINEFTRMLRNNGMQTVEQQHELQDRAGGGKKESTWGYVRTITPLIMLGIAFYMSTKLLEQERT